VPSVSDLASFFARPSDRCIVAERKGSRDRSWARIGGRF
jgi:hypothetical protein